MNELSTLRCIHFGACSGCVLSKDLEVPPIWEDIKKYFPFHISLETGLVRGWRTKAKLAIRGNFDAPQIGLFRAGSHDVQTISACQAHHGAINRAAAVLASAIREEKISIYNERNGLLRYAQFFVDLATEKVQLVLVVQSKNASLERLARRLEKMGFWHSIWFNVQNAVTNRIFGEEWILFGGEKHLSQKLNGQSFLLHPASFAQAHWTLFEKLAGFVVEEVPKGAHLLELYAGIGAMGCLAAPKCASVHLVENNPFSYDSFLACKHPSSIGYHLENADGSRLRDATCILVDPPRKGIDLALLQALEVHRGKLIYVSCDFTSFVRDADRLRDNGWALTKGKGYLLFPGTNHVEIVAVFDKL